MYLVNMRNMKSYLYISLRKLSISWFLSYCYFLPHDNGLCIEILTMSRSIYFVNSNKALIISQNFNN